MPAVSGRTLTFLKATYWVVFSLAQIYICYLLFKAGRPITGSLWLLVGFAILFVMYAVFFPFGDPEAKWPPYISSCPDYLTVLVPNYCVDYVGLNSMLKKSDPAFPPVSTDGTYVFDASGSNAQKAARAQQLGLTWEGVF